MTTVMFALAGMVCLVCLQDEDLCLTLDQLLQPNRGIVTVATEAFALV